MEHSFEIMPDNSVFLRGVLPEPPEFSHENHGRRFERMTLWVRRLSGTFDQIQIIAPEGPLEPLDPSTGPMLEVTGQIRSYNNRTGSGRKLLISVYAQELSFSWGEPENHITLRGQLCREPVYRHTPLGREITDIMLSVPRPYGRRDYIPCILWGSLARLASGMARGDTLSLEGRLQSRLYTKQTELGPEERTAYEVSAITAQREP